MRNRGNLKIKCQFIGHLRHGQGCKGNGFSSFNTVMNFLLCVWGGE